MSIRRTEFCLEITSKSYKQLDIYEKESNGAVMISMEDGESISMILSQEEIKEVISFLQEQVTPYNSYSNT